MEELITIV